MIDMREDKLDSLVSDVAPFIYFNQPLIRAKDKESDKITDGSDEIGR